MERLGVPREQLESHARGGADQEDDGAICVAPHLSPAINLFAHLRSQWRTASAGMGGFLYSGLDYAAIEPAMRLMGLEPADRPEMFRQLRVMEMEARDAMNER
ncbi:MAG: DUF1799 domain-containing protein [Pseudomonadota bacterium]